MSGSATHPLGDKIIIAGPCSVESPEQIAATARALARLGITALRGGIWKPRTRPGSFQGVGEQGLKWLKSAGRASGLPVACEIAIPEHAELCLKHGVDILWIGARTSVNPFAVQAIADSLRGVDVPVMVKNPMNPDIELWIGAIERLQGAGLKQVSAIHRGFSTWQKTAFRNAPLWRIPLDLRRRMPKVPMLCDPSHICGCRDLLEATCQEALDLLFDGLMIEVHPRPDEALSDASQQITPDELAAMLGRLRRRKLTSRVDDYRRHIDELREKIDHLDTELLDLLSRRMATVREISRHKRKYSVGAFQPGRWKEIVASRSDYGEAQGLSRDFVLGVFQHIHEEAIRHQEAENALPPEPKTGG